jgi:hypothetical protein
MHYGEFERGVHAAAVNHPGSKNAPGKGVSFQFSREKRIA